jgi:chromosome segregation ATPase
MASHRASFVPKKDLRERLTLISEERQQYLEALRQANALGMEKIREYVKLKTLVTELEGQVQVQSTLVTTARVASQESHKGFAAMKVEYQKAYDRATKLQAENYQLAEELTGAEKSINLLLDARPWCTKIQEWFTRVTRRPRY